MVFDSAGIRVTVSSAGAGTSMWTLVPEPQVTVGGEGLPGRVDGDHLFGRIGPGRLLPGGGFAVVDEMAQRVVLFHEDGSQRATFGGGGDGPGEFRVVTGLAGVAGDTLVAFDTVNRRATTFTADGQLVSLVPLETEPYSREGALLRGVGYVFRETWALVDASPGSFARDTVTLTLFDLDGRRIRQLARVPGLRFYGVGQRPVIMPFTPEPAFATGVALYHLSGDRFEYTVVDVDGTVTHIGRLDVEPAAATAGDMQSWHRWLRSQVPDDIPAAVLADLDRTFQAVPTPEALPALSDLLLDGDDNVWVGEYRPSWARGARRWYVFDPAHRLEATVMVPGHVRVLDVRGDHVLVAAGEDLVPVVQVMELGRGPDTLALPVNP